MANTFRFLFSNQAQRWIGIIMSSIFSTFPPFSLSICGLLGFANSLQTILYWFHGPQILQFPNALFLCFFSPSFCWEGRRTALANSSTCAHRCLGGTQHAASFSVLPFSPLLLFLESALHKYPPLPQFCLQRDGEKGVVCIQRIRHVCQNGLPPSHRNGPFCQDFTLSLTKMATLPYLLLLNPSKQKNSFQIQKISSGSLPLSRRRKHKESSFAPWVLLTGMFPLYPRLSEGA